MVCVIRPRTSSLRALLAAALCYGLALSGVLGQLKPAPGIFTLSEVFCGSGTLPDEPGHDDCRAHCALGSSAVAYAFWRTALFVKFPQPKAIVPLFWPELDKNPHFLALLSVRAARPPPVMA